MLRQPAHAPRRWRARVAGLVALAAVAAAVATIPLLAWVRSYEPLASNGGGPATRAFPRFLRSSEPGLGFEGRMAVVGPGSFAYVYFISSDGRWPVTVDRVDVDPASGLSVESVRPLGRPYSGGGVTAVGRSKLRFARRSDAQLVVRFRADCSVIPAGGYGAPVEVLRFRYRYLRFFSRSQYIPVDDRITLHCPAR